MDSTIKEWEDWIERQRARGFSQEQIDAKLESHLKFLKDYFIRLDGLRNELIARNSEVPNKDISSNQPSQESIQSKPSLSDKVDLVSENLRTLADTPKKVIKESFFSKNKDQINAAVMLVLALAVIIFIASVVL